MRLINCYIENFGKLHEFSMDFQEGLHVICQENGWGKSTLAAFIRIMFYGFEGEKKRKQARERVFYQPWQGGTYGGKITFEAGEKQYILERTFGKKESEDAFCLRAADTNLESTDYTSQIGRELFGIDSESFMRTIYIRQNDCVTAATGDMNAKMGNQGENTDDLVQYDDANKRLADIFNKMTPHRKTGLLYGLKQQLTQLETEVKKEGTLNQTIQNLKERIEEKKQILQVLKKEQEEIIKRQKLASEQKELQGKRERYEEICERCEAAYQKYVAAKTAFPGKIPEKTEIDAAFSLCTEMDKVSSAAEVYRLNEKEQQIFIEEEKRFTQGIPTEEEYMQIKESIRQLKNLRKKESVNRMTGGEKDRLNCYKEWFGKEGAVYGTAAGMLQKWNDRMSRSNMLEVKKANLEQLKFMSQIKENRMSEKKAWIGLVVGGLLLLAGAFLFTAEVTAGMALILVGIVFSTAGVLERKKSGKRQENSSQIFALEKQIQEDKKQIESIDEAIKQYVKKFNFTFEEDKVQLCLQKSVQAELQYEDLLKKEKREKENSFEAECKQLNSAIAFVFLKYAFSAKEEDYVDALLNLKHKAQEYERLRRRNNDYLEAKRQICKMQEQLNTFIKGLGYEPETALMQQIIKLQDQLSVYVQIHESYQKEKQEKERFEQQYDMQMLCGKVPKKATDDLMELNQTYEKLNLDMEDIKQQLNLYMQQMKDYEQEEEEIAEAKEKLENLKRQFSEYSEQYELLKKTEEFLTKAKESLTARYIKPLKEQYTKYYEKISGNSAKMYHIDANTNITVKEQGLQRETMFFSAGYRDLIGLCLRLAFADVMYKEEKPMLILDDPFVNLDEKKVSGGKRLLQEAAKDYQILYLTCSESRI